jgi:hypothetical protein
MRHSRAANALRRGRAAARRRVKSRLAAGAPGAEHSGDGAGLELNGSEALVPDEEVWPLRELFAGRATDAGISYATAADLAESANAMEKLIAASPPPLGIQRGWAIKALLGSVPEGAAILEVAGSGPLAAGVLARLGYEVTVLDPFDGSASEPHRFSAVSRDYSALEFIRDRFPTTTPLPRPYAAVYSTGLLDRLEPERVGAIGEAAIAALEPGGVLVFSFAHVIAGWGAEEAAARLEQLARAIAIGEAEIAAALTPMADDPETYLVSAEAHDSWRGAVPYASYPMRRIGSLNVLARRASAR